MAPPPGATQAGLAEKATMLAAPSVTGCSPHVRLAKIHGGDPGVGIAQIGGIDENGDIKGGGIRRRLGGGISRGGICPNAATDRLTTGVHQTALARGRAAAE
jgi:hypothetical protein